MSSIDRSAAERASEDHRGTRRAVLAGAGIAGAYGLGQFLGPDDAAAQLPIDDRYVLRSRAAFNVKDYGATGNGTTDDYDAIQATIQAAEAAKGGVVLFPPGKYFLNKTNAGGLKLKPHNMSDERGWLLLSGTGAWIKLSSNVPRFLDFDKSATVDHETFQRIAVVDFLIDGNDVGGQGHTVIGTLYDGTGWQKRINVRDVLVRGVTTVNVKGDASGTIDRRGVAIVVKHEASNESTRNHLTNIRVEDCDFRGGNYGVTVAATCTGNNANVRIDRVAIVRCRHDTLVSPTATASAANFFIGSAGFGGSCWIQSCCGANSPDVGIEIDGMTYSLVESTTIQDAIQANFFVRNFNAPEDPGAQTAVFRDCHARVVNLRPDGPTYPSIGFALSHQTGPNPPVEHVILDGCTFLSKSPTFGAGGQAIYAYESPLRRLTVRDFTAVADAVDFSPSSDRWPSTITVASTVPMKLAMDGVHVKVAGTKGGSSALTYRALWYSGRANAPSAFAISDFTIDYDLAGLAPGSTYLLNLGEFDGTMGGTIEGLRIARFAGGDSAPKAVRIHASSKLTIDPVFRFERCDFSKLPSGATEVEFVSGNKDKVRFRSVVWRSFPAAPSEFAAPASGSAYRNLDGQREDVYIRGGAVTKVEVSRNGSTYFELPADTRMVSLDNGDYLKLTHTSAPTLTKLLVD